MLEQRSARFEGIEIKTMSEIDTMRQGGARLGEILQRLGEAIRPGIRTNDIDRMADELARRAGGVPAFLGYHGFPCSACISVNEEVVHGIPSDRMLWDGDIVSLDFGLLWNGFHTDAAVTLPVGPVKREVQDLLDVTRDSLARGIEQCRPGGHVQDVGRAIQLFVEQRGYSVIREYVGHGIGRSLHENPQVPNFQGSARGSKLREGMVLAIEPMTSMGSYGVRVLSNGWTAVTADRSLSAHFEHTVAITENGPRILTLP